jgi:hypothetical protein
MEGNSRPARRWCELHLALGEQKLCPGSSCGLWHENACVLEAVRRELANSPAVSRHLLELRRALEDAAAAETMADAGSLLSRRLNEEQAAET